MAASHNIQVVTQTYLDWLDACQYDVIALQETYDKGATILERFGAARVILGGDPPDAGDGTGSTDKGSGVAFLLSKRICDSVDDQSEAGSRLCWIHLELKGCHQGAYVVNAYLPYKDKLKPPHRRTRSRHWRG